MSRTSALIVLGIVIILTPFSGLPASLRALLAVICGACVLGIGLRERANEVHNHQQSVETPPPPPTISPV